MKKLLKVISVAIMAMGLGSQSYASYNVDDEVADVIGCGIWLCLPGGFPSDPQNICSAGKSKMISRLKDFKAPLQWSDCKSNSRPLEPQPYKYDYGYYFFENFGKSSKSPYYTTRKSGYYELGGSRNLTYSNGQIIERKQVGCGTTVWTLVGIYAQGWSIGNLKGLEGYEDFTHVIWNKGLPIEEVNKPFTPREIRRTHNQGQCR